MVVVQSLRNETQGRKDLRKVVDPAVFVSGGFFNQLGVSKPLDDEPVSQDDAEYR